MNERNIITVTIVGTCGFVILLVALILTILVLRRRQVATLFEPLMTQFIFEGGKWYIRESRVANICSHEVWNDGFLTPGFACIEVWAVIGSFFLRRNENLFEAGRAKTERVMRSEEDNALDVIFVLYACRFSWVLPYLLVLRLSTLSYTTKTENRIYTVKTCFSIFLKWLIFCRWNVTYPRYYNLPTKDLQLSFAYLIFLDRPMLSSSSDALKMLQWYTLKQKRSIYRCLYICK